MKYKPTPEQEAIFAYDGDMKIEAVAGSGKTTTLIEYARRRPKGSKMLYLVFNKSAKEDALDKFARSGVTGVNVQTAHGLAYGSIMVLPKYSLINKGYNSFDLMVKLNIEGDNRFTLATHVRQFISGFCNSDCRDIEDYDYVHTLAPEAQEFILPYLPMLFEWATTFWELMDSGKIEVTHEFYLKKYQLVNPKLKYDYIMFDEGQDASPVMLDIFLDQECKKIIVGDTHQQIYAWRGAVNSLAQVDFPTFTLSQSFRFGEDIATLANNILKAKGSSSKVIGAAKHKNNNCYTDAIISRTNIALLREMIKWMNRNPDDLFYFEGNINSLLFTEEGVSVYDVIALYEDKPRRIKNKFIKSFHTFKKFQTYCQQADDRELGTMGILADIYGSKLSGIMKNLKEACAEDRDDAEIVFTSAHKSKGLEYDRVILTNDYATREEEDVEDLTEQINILYVAITRAKKEVVLPKDFNFYIDFQ